MLRPFTTDLLTEVVAFLGQCWRDDPARNFHPGDVLHWMTNYCRGENLDKRFFLARDADELRAFIEINEKSSTITAVVKPKLRGTDWERELYLSCMEKLKGASTISVNLSSKDEKTSEVLRSLNFTSEMADCKVLRRDLSSVPEPTWPNGFSARRVTGFREAEALAGLHGAAFNNSWTPAEYQKVMRAPGFVPQNELVVVAPIGALAAFAVIWPDRISKTGLFEPVGCHPDFVRKGLTRALLYFGMARLREMGMESAIVGHEPSNAAAKALYGSVGFSTYFDTVDYTKTL